ncbi:MAG: biotin transporter BioY [Alphaproteobacteria bacterium]|nr:biotin transporter BioY [Alphaproteobacteria bacterium]MBU0795973.1 biotin transporter BioY [Alphaproteobacteria bacterium]MBU0885661.1 biotin transporter BioY [Alphaproteobacteria bacterium]MBU1812683.1 biotin transporter BioY [Alphaproteobacteria bacterium]MBU2090838.1 biotin transporter BioY [Alphaproteobacteria bacterium]
MTSLTGSSALIERLWPSRSANGLWRSALLIGFGSVFLAVLAQVKVPMWPVPITLQTFAVLLVGITYGFRLGTATILFYMAQGAIGLPVFAGGIGGLAVLMGPTGGYLAGFILAVMATGALADRGWSQGVVKAVAALVIGNALIYAAGVSYLHAAFVPDLHKAVMLGVAPFLIGDALKIALAVAVLQLSWKRSEK